MRLLDPPLRRASLLSNAEVARPMALSHSGPEGVPQALDFMGFFGLASFRQKLLCRHNVYKVYRLIGKPAVRKFIRMKPLNLRPHAITSITAS